MTGRLRRWSSAARLVASAVMLAVLVDRAHVASLVPTRRGGGALMAAALAASVLAAALSALRWQRVLSALDRPAGYLRLARLYLASMFVGSFLPSTVGGDVVRVTRLGAENGSTSDSFASVVLERLTGWLVLPVLTLAGLISEPRLLSLGVASVVALTVSAATLVLLAAVLVAAGHPGLGGRLAGPGGWRRFLGAVHVGVTRFRARPAAAASVIVTAFAYQLALTWSVYLAARALGVAVGWEEVLAFFPMVAVIQLAPLTIGGLGAREGAFVLFLHPLGVPARAAVALGLAVYGLTLVTSLLGAPAFALYRSPAGGESTEPASSAGTVASRPAR